MTDKNSPRESCDPQLSDQQPTEGWGIQELGRYAQARHQEIEAEEHSLTRAYWRLGLSLNLARRQFAHGQWTNFLDELGIDRTRASKARAIQNSFETEQAVEGMSVQEAYGRRKRKIRKPSAKKKREKKNRGTSMFDWLLDVCNKVDFYSDEVDFASADDAATLLPAIENAVEELTKIRRRLQQRIDAQ